MPTGLVSIGTCLIQNDCPSIRTANTTATTAESCYKQLIQIGLGRVIAV